MDIRPISSLIAPAGPDATALATAAGKARSSAPVTPSGDAAKTAAVTKLQQRAPDKEELTEAINSINTALKDRTPGLEFSVDKDSQRAIVKVIDKDTREVIRQMPSREALEIAKSLETLQSLLGKQSA